MDKDEIIRMAREAGFMVVAEGEPDIGDWYECFVDEIKLFAALVAAHEREACAKVCEEEHDQSKFGVNGMHCAAAIRARSNHG